MDFLKQNNNVATQPIPPELDMTKIIEWFVGSVTFLIGFFKIVDSYFAHKKRDKQEFIERVVRATMDSCLADIKSELHEFKKETAASMEKFNGTVLDIYREVRK